MLAVGPFRMLMMVACIVPMVCADTRPDLPPMSAMPEPGVPNSVPMGDPADFPETNRSFNIADGPYAPTWESIASHYPGEPNWLREAKFGIWVHYQPGPPPG